MSEPQYELGPKNQEDLAKMDAHIAERRASIDRLLAGESASETAKELSELIEQDRKFTAMREAIRIMTGE